MEGGEGNQRIKFTIQPQCIFHIDSDVKRTSTTTKLPS